MPSSASASQSQNSATQPSPPKHLTDAATNDDGLIDTEAKKPDLLDQFEDFDNFNSVEKYKKHEADYAQRLMTKYYSKRNLYGETSTIFAGNVFEENTTIDNEIISQAIALYAVVCYDPVQGFEDTEAADRHPPWKSTVPSQMGSLL